MSKGFTDLEVWQQARKLTSLVYSLTKSFPKEELFGLTNQLRRAAISVPLNIAEGAGRYTKKDNLQFLFIARGSLYELECQLYLAADQLYISSNQLEELLSEVNRSKKLLNGFISYLRKEAQ